MTTPRKIDAFTQADNDRIDELERNYFDILQSDDEKQIAEKRSKKNEIPDNSGMRSQHRILSDESVIYCENSLDSVATTVEDVWAERPSSGFRQQLAMSSNVGPKLGKDFDDFKMLSSVKQNAEIYKILNSIVMEIEALKISTEKRFSSLEKLILKNPSSVIKSDHHEYNSKKWDTVRQNRSYNHFKNMAGPCISQRTPDHHGKNSSGVPISPNSSMNRQGSGNWPGIIDLEYLQEKAKTADNPVILNIGGKKYETTWSLLERLPQTRLGKLRSCRTEEEILELCDGFDPENNEYRFERQPRNFSCILNFLSTGKLHLGEDTCVIAFSQDMEYWGIDDLYLEPCCVQRYYQQRELLNWDHQVKKEEENEVFREGRIGKFQKILWDLFEKPHTSLGARIVAIISISFIIISTIVLTLNTLPYFSAKSQEHEKDYPPFAFLEAIYMSWFTFEFAIRFLSSPSKLRFIKSLMNIIDLLAILPYFVSIALVNSTDVGQLTEVRRIAQFFRIMRILRIFKLARHSVGLQSLGFTLKNSYKELGLLMLFLTMGVLIFSSLAYVFEKDDKDTSFSTMMDAYWWALITMTTVGYGDISPSTGFGKVIGSCCAICGVLVIALPIPIIGNNFAAFYKNERRREQLAEKKLAIERARRKGAIQPFPGQNLPLDDEDRKIPSDDDEQGSLDKNRIQLDVTKLDAESLSSTNNDKSHLELSFLKSRTATSILNGMYSTVEKNSSSSISVPKVSVQ